MKDYRPGEGWRLGRFLFLFVCCLFYLERDGGLVGGEEGVPVELPLQLFPVLAVHQLEHGLVHHVRLRMIVVYNEDIHLI